LTALGLVTYYEMQSGNGWSLSHQMCYMIGYTVAVSSFSYIVLYFLFENVSIIMEVRVRLTFWRSCNPPTFTFNTSPQRKLKR